MLLSHVDTSDNLILTTIKHHLPLILCEIALLLSLLVLNRPLIRGDAIAYFMWTTSIGRDFDMNLQNQAEHFGELNTYMAIRNSKTGHYGNAFAWGQGILLQPAFQAARLIDQLPMMRINDDWFYGLQRYPYAYSLMAMLQVNVMTMISLALVYALARQIDIAPTPAAWAGLMTAWGTPLLYYTTIQPLYSHATATFVHTSALVFFLLNLNAQCSLPWWRWLSNGLVFGLAALVRWQLALSIIPCGAILIYLSLKKTHQVSWSALLLLGLGFTALIWHIPYTFNWMFGSPFATAMGPGFVSTPKFLWEILFSNYRGLFLWSPIAVLGLLGLVIEPHHHWESRFILLSTIIAQILISASVKTWSGGESFGLRRLTELYPALTIGVAMLLAASQHFAQRFVYALTGVLALYGIILLFAFLIFSYFTLPEMGYVSQQPVDSLSNVLTFFLFPPKFHLIWPMMEHHFGLWAWSMPGP